MFPAISAGWIYKNRPPDFSGGVITIIIPNPQTMSNAIIHKQFYVIT